MGGKDAKGLQPHQLPQEDGQRDDDVKMQE